MSFFTRRKILALALAAPLCEGAFWLYNEWNQPWYKALAWSPDGSGVVCDYGHADGFDGAVVIVPKNGGREIVLHDNPGGSEPCRAALFSPDGRKVAFEHFGLYVTDADGKNVRKLGSYLGLGWSSDGEWLAVEDEGRKFEIHTRTDEKRKFAGKTPPKNDSSREEYSPQRLPNGDFVIPRWNTNDRGQIWLVNGKTLRGNELVRGSYPLVSPQGDTLAYTDERGWLRFLALD